MGGEENVLLAVGELGGTSSSSFSMPMAMMPRDMTLLKSLSGVFLTVPLRVAKKTNLSSSSRSRTRSKRARFRPAAARPDCRCACPCRRRYVGNLVHLEPIDAAGVGEDEDVVVGGGDEQLLDEIFFARAHALAAGAAAPLLAIGGDRVRFRYPAWLTVTATCSSAIRSSSWISAASS